jgi:hypothetical protein
MRLTGTVSKIDRIPVEQHIRELPCVRVGPLGRLTQAVPSGRHDRTHSQATSMGSGHAVG